MFPPLGDVTVVALGDDDDEDDDDAWCGDRDSVVFQLRNLQTNFGRNNV